MIVFKQTNVDLKGDNMAKKVVLSCEQCGSRNYTVPTSKEGTSERLELKKFCSHCKAHTVHKQTL
ncbi:50S ribosomal protein L33 [Paenisporosarcina indica]|uniref:50S ribosomal protein L33 n=1 Tax=Paenisporosarcina indica TaxID=650093 RepID=UPI003CCBF6CF